MKNPKIIRQVLLVLSSFLLLATTCENCYEELDFYDSRNNSLTKPLRVAYLPQGGTCTVTDSALTNYLYTYYNSGDGYYYSFEEDTNTCLLTTPFEEIYAVKGNTNITDATSLILNPNADSTTFVFAQNGQQDTLRFGYKRTTEYFSEGDCGNVMFYTRISILKNTLDSVRVINTKPWQMVIFVN